MVKEKHKEKRTKTEIQSEVYLRLAYYKIHHSATQIQIQEWIKLGKKSRIQTKNLLNEKGWVFLDHIESKPCPYGSPQTHRYAYLKNKNIETKTFIYRVKKPNDINYRWYRETVYRLKSDLDTKKRLIAFIRGNASQLYEKFMLSDYIQDNTDDETKMIYSLIFDLQTIADTKMFYGKFILKNDLENISISKKAFERIIKDTENVKNIIKKQVT